jgi:hypothetical protein
MGITVIAGVRMVMVESMGGKVGIAPQDDRSTVKNPRTRSVDIDFISLSLYKNIQYPDPKSDPVYCAHSYYCASSLPNQNPIIPTPMQLGLTSFPLQCYNPFDHPSP